MNNIGRPTHQCAHAVRLSQLLLADDVDAAIEQGLMEHVACADCDPVTALRLEETQRKLLEAWASRDRYLARKARLENRSAEKHAKRARSIPEKKTTLPDAAAEILARAKARAFARNP